MPERRFIWRGVALAAIVAGVALNRVFPLLSSFLPLCSVRRWTGLLCPGCGGTRCARHLLQADVSGALAMNPLVVLLALLAGAWLLHAVVAEWRGKRAFVPSAWMGWSLLGLVVVFTVARNIPSWPFTILAPK
jgi:hypothetical protein